MRTAAAVSARLAVLLPSGKYHSVGPRFASELEARAAQAVLARRERLSWRKEPTHVLTCAGRTRVSATRLVPL